MDLERSNPISETIVFDEAFPSDDDADDPALDAMSGIGCSLLAGGMAETGADDGNPDELAVVVIAAAVVDELLFTISLRFNAS